MKVRYLSDAEETRLRKALDAREERRRAERDSANHWRRERGYVQLPSLRTVMFTDHVKPLILLLINTGCRRGELFDLTWSNVDLDRRILTVTGATAKSKRKRHIPLNREATRVLQGWRARVEDERGLVFVNDEGKRFDRVSFSWRHLLKDAYISNFRWHDMRHHFASRLVMGGAMDRAFDALTIVADGGTQDIAKPLAGLGAGVWELAIKERGDAYRVVYALQVGDEIWVVHAFQKKST